MPENAEPIREIEPLGEIESERLESQQFVDQTKVLEEESIRLLEERLVVNTTKHKVGEIIVRKEIETRMVQVPIRSEKLIVEQVGTQAKRIAEIKLGEGTLSGVELADGDRHQSVVRGEFLSLAAVSDLLGAIASGGKHGCKKVRVELVLEDPTRQAEYQEMFNRCTQP